MVSGSGEVTVYKYNEWGEIESVYYPYSESLELAAKKEALEAGLYPKYPEYEWYAYSGEESILIKKAFERIYKNLPYVNLRGQHVWSEHYTYDNNSNRITKTTQYGTINYTYDDENRLRYSGREKLVNLEEEIGGRITFRENDEIYHAATNDSVSYSTNSLRGTRFTYDKNGNMLSSENLYSVKFFDYNAINRMKLSTVTDLTEHSYTATTYAYDGFGRRTLTQTEGHTANRTLYDSTGFEILRQGTADSNGSFINPTEAQNRYSPYYPYNGGGYYGNRYGYADYFYYLFFGGIWGFGNGGHGSKNGQEEAPEYLTIENMYPLYANGTVAGTYKEDLVYSPHKHYWNSWTNLWGADTSRYDDYATYKETLYFGTDALGSVRTTSSYSVFDFGSINYDVFGSPYRRAGSFLNSESLDFGYLGKPYNATTELYDYGFRDYSPRNARFTTVDPIRDGRNWYTYVLNNPVNYVDLWGLSRDNDQTTDNLSDVKKEIIQYLIPETSINRQGTKITKVKAIVIHWTEAPNQKPTATIDYWSSDVRVGSAHFVIGTDDSIYQAIPTDERARHAGNTSGEYREKATELFGEGINPNAYSIGIEMEPIDANGKFNQATIDSAIQLTSDLCKEFGLDPQKEVIRHYDVTGKNCPKYYVDNENEWNNFIEQVTNQTNGSKK